MSNLNCTKVVAHGPKFLPSQGNQMLQTMNEMGKTNTKISEDRDAPP